MSEHETLFTTIALAYEDYVSMKNPGIWALIGLFFLCWAAVVRPQEKQREEQREQEAKKKTRIERMRSLAVAELKKRGFVISSFDSVEVQPSRIWRVTLKWVTGPPSEYESYREPIPTGPFHVDVNEDGTTILVPPDPGLEVPASSLTP